MKSHRLLVLMLVAACVGAVVRPLLLSEVHAAAAQRCDWRYLEDKFYPEVPSGMDNKKRMSAEWTALGNAGYHLAPGSMDSVYMFERCQ
jgi:hypothetical protein